MFDPHPVRTLRRRSFKEILLYVAINAAIIGAICALFAAGMSWDGFVKWFGLAFITTPIFWYFISDTRSLWKKKPFWGFIIACLCVHCAAWIAILIHVEHWKFIWFTPVIIELSILIFLRDWLFRNTHRKKLKQ